MTMRWRERTDLWYGLALVRPNDGKGNAGGAYVSFVVIDRSLPTAVAKLDQAVTSTGWSLSSLESMKLAFDYLGEEDIDSVFAPIVSAAEASGIALGSFHTFPLVEQITS